METEKSLLNKKTVLLVAGIAFLLYLIFSCNNESTDESAKIDPRIAQYQNAYALAVDGYYDEALSIFKSLGDFEDSARHVEGIECIKYAEILGNQLKLPFVSLSLGGMDVYCEYYPADYTFVQVLEIPANGLMGILSSWGASLGEDVSISPEGSQRNAEDLYFDHFYSEGYYGIICAVEVRDYANDQFIRGTFSGYDNIQPSDGEGYPSIADIQAYAETRPKEE